MLFKDTRETSLDAELRRSVNRMIDVANTGDIFAPDEHAVSIWNGYFRQLAIYKSDLELLSVLSDTFLGVANHANSRVVLMAQEKMLAALASNCNQVSDSELFLDGLPKLGALITQEMRNEIRDLYVSEYEGAKYSRNFNENFTLCTQYFNAISPDRHARVLDIGTGFGFLPFIFKSNGHSVEAMDIESAPSQYAQSCGILGLNRHDFEIRRYIPVLTFKEKFDIITCTQICFNGHGTSALWKRNEWLFFLKDICENLLTESGFIWLCFNYEPRNAVETTNDSIGHEDVEALFSPYYIDGVDWKIAKLYKHDIDGLAA